MDKKKKMWYIYTMQCYSVLTKNKVLIHAATWLNLEDITLSEVSQTQKDKYYSTHMRYLKLEVDSGEGCLIMWIYVMLLNYALKIAKMVNFIFYIFYHNFFLRAVNLLPSKNPTEEQNKISLTSKLSGQYFRSKSQGGVSTNITIRWSINLRI